MSLAQMLNESFEKPKPKIKPKIKPKKDKPVIKETPKNINVKSFNVPMTDMFSWFNKNVNELSNISKINQVKIVLRGVNSNETLIVTVPDGSGEIDELGNEKRQLRIFEKAHKINVLDGNVVKTGLYNKGFRIIYKEDDLYIKTYSVRSGMQCVLCINIDGMLIPFKIMKIKKKDGGFITDVAMPDINYIKSKLNEKADIDTIRILYKQSEKAMSEFTTNESMIKWLLEIQESLTDINHHIQIDNAMIGVLS